MRCPGRVEASQAPAVRGRALRAGVGGREAGCVLAPDPRTCINREAVPLTAADALAGLSRSSKALALRTKERPRRTQSRGSAPRILRHYRYWEKYAALGRSACATKPAETKQ